MMSNSEFGSISFDLPKNQSNVIKVIGVGGGGSNAINHMFKQGIKGGLLLFVILILRHYKVVQF
jgi:cell division protein FtsZ